MPGDERGEDRGVTDYARFWTAATEAEGQWMTDPGHKGEDYWYVGEAQAAQLGPYLPKLGRVWPKPVVVDYGCGLGRTLRCLPAFERAGLDVSADHLALAERLSPGPSYLLTDGRTIPLPDDCADLVYSFQVLQHLDVDDAASIVAETRRVLRSGGQCYHTFSLFGKPWQPGLKLRRGPGCEAMDAIAYTRDLVHTLAHAAGFRVHEVLDLAGRLFWQDGSASTLDYAVLRAVKP
jgi:SAM-dependent methyltransferase